MPSIDRQRLAEKIIDLLKDYAYPFGGYLRDLIACDEFTDIDLFFPQMDRSNYLPLSQANNSMSAMLMKAGLKVLRVGKKSVYNRGTGIRLSKETFQISDDNGQSINIDCVRSQNGLSSLDNPFTALDADVNALWLNKRTGRVEAAPRAGYDLDTIINHIIRKVFEIPAGAEVSQERLVKLFKKGYKPLDADNTNPDSVRKEAKMDNFTRAATLSLGDQFKSDFEKAAYRSCGTQMTGAVKQGILTALKAYGAEEGVIAFFTKVLDTDGGTAGVSAMLGHTLPHAPMVGNDPRIVRLSEEFRVAGYSQGLDIVMAALMQFILPGVMSALQALPPVAVSEKDMAELDQISKAKMRVGGMVPSIPNLVEQEHLAEQEMAAPKHATKHA